MQHRVVREAAATEVRGAWWVPPSLGALAFVAAIVAVGFDRVYETLFAGRDALEASLLSGGLVGVLAFGATFVALTARERSVSVGRVSGRSVGLAALGANVPWCGGLAVAHLAAAQSTHGTFGGIAPFDRSTFASSFVLDAHVLHALGAASSAGLALGLAYVFVRGGREATRAGAESLVLVAAGLCASADAALAGLAVRALAELRTESLLGPSADAWVTRLSELETLRDTLAIVTLATGAIAVVLVARRTTSRRARVVTSLACLGIVATPTAVRLAQGHFVERVDRWAHPAWLAVEGFEPPILNESFEEVVEAAGVVLDDRWIDAEGVSRDDFSALARTLREAADRGEERARAWGYLRPASSTPDPGARGIPRPHAGGRVVGLAIDTRVGATRWRALVDAFREADVRRVCLATRVRDDERRLVSLPPRRGVGWFDAVTPTPATVACFDTQAALPESWPDDQSEIFELRLGAREHVALRALPGNAPTPIPGVVSCDEHGVMRGQPNPTAAIVLGDGMTTRSLVALDDVALRVPVKPILAWAPLSQAPTTNLEDAPPAALRADPNPRFAVEPTMSRVHVDPLEIAAERAVEIFGLVDHDPRFSSEEPTYTRAVERVVARGPVLARCYADERARDPGSGGRVHLSLVTDLRGGPLDAACTRSPRSSSALCECFEASMLDEAGDASTIDAAVGAPRLTVTLWLQGRDADRPSELAAGRSTNEPVAR